jgi:hypothetical protein
LRTLDQPYFVTCDRAVFDSDILFQVSHRRQHGHCRCAVATPRRDVFVMTDGPVGMKPSPKRALPTLSQESLVIVNVVLLFPPLNESPRHFTLYFLISLLTLCSITFYALHHCTPCTLFFFFSPPKPLKPASPHRFRTPTRAPFLIIFLHLSLLLASLPAGCTSMDVLPFFRGAPSPASHPRTHMFAAHCLDHSHTRSFSSKPPIPHIHSHTNP